jgi:glucosamine--fructose-6-phosphate aminotransferase (isomerizing)
MPMNPYFVDILAQPAALRHTISQFPHLVISKIRKEIHKGKFDRIIMTGMGASFNAAYPAFIQLTSMPAPASLLNSAELSRFLNGVLTGKTLLWLNSQSGRSVELLNILDHINTKPVACSLSFVNDSNSPLAVGAGYSISIQAGEESIVSTKTYTNMLAANLLSAIQLSNNDVNSARQELLTVADKMETYLKDWDAHLKQIKTFLGNVNRMFILGRGSSLSTVWNASLVFKEAAKFPAEGINAADFRHGPLELASREITVIYLEGAQQTSKTNRAFAEEIANLGANVIWVGSNPHPELSTLSIPEVPDLFLPIMEILPMQLISIYLAESRGLIAGRIHHIGKVTSKE